MRLPPPRQVATTILVQRSGALGDVVLTTPVIRRLRRENPAARIGVLTGYAEVFDNSPHLIGGSAPNAPSLVKHIQLDGAYELLPNMHIVEAYMLETFGDTGDALDRQQELFYRPITMYERHKRYVAVHAAVAGWTNRSLPRETWRAVVNGLRKAGFNPILVGSPRDELFDVDGAITFYNGNILAQAAVIDACACFVGSDSGVLHIAGATNTPIVGVFTCAQAETRLPWRNGVLGRACVAITPDIACAGCLARRPPPVTTEHCERGDTACVTMVKADEIIEAVISIISLTH